MIDEDDDDYTGSEEESVLEELDEATIKRNRQIVLEMCKPFILDEEDLEKIKKMLLIEIKRGLCRRTHKKAMLKCYPTFVREVPKGCERGNFLALEIGSSKLQIVLVQLRPEEEINLVSQDYEFSKTLMEGPGRALFDHIAACLSNFIHKYEIENEVAHMGVTFCFPLRQIGLSKGFLVRWSKGFKCSGVLGRDVVALLREAIVRRRDFKVGVIAILNDTTDTLMTCAWKNKYAKIGVIIDDGSNACYLEKTKYVDTIRTNLNAPQTMIINTEWGAFGEKGNLDHICTKFDKVLDENSLHPGEQIFEKLISGLYLGELVRLIITECVSANAMFRNRRLPTELAEMNSISSHQIIEFLKSDADDNTKILNYLLKVGCREPTEDDCANVRYICEQVFTRSANLVGAAISCLIDRIGDAYTVVGIDGFIYNDYPTYGNILLRVIKQLTKPEHKFNLCLSHGGTGRGAALVAAVAVFAKKERRKQHIE